jgi:hypothetical protein
MVDNGSLNGQSRSRRTARPYVLAVVALGVLIALVVMFAKPRETREGAVSPVVAGSSTAPPTSTAASPGTGGEGTREMPDAGPPLDSTAPPKG